MTASLASPSPIATSGLALGIACAATALPCASVYMTQPIFPEIAAGLGVEAPDARLVFTVTSLAYALAFFVFGPLSDRYPARVVAAWGCLAQAAVTALAATCRDFNGFLALSAVIGVVAAAIPASMYALIGRWAPRDHLAAAMGMVIAASVVGVILGRSLTGIVADALGWRATFLGMAGLYLVLLPLLALLPRCALDPSDRPSLAKVYGNALSLLTRAPVLRLLALGFLLFVGYLGVLSILTYRLKEAPFYYDAATIGWISLLGLSAVLGAPLAGSLLPRFGARRMLSAGLGLVLAALALLAVAQPLPLIVGIVMMFLGVFACQPVMFTLLARTVPAEARGTSSSLYFLVCLGSGGIATAALGPLWRTGGWLPVVAAGAAAVLMALGLARAATRPAPASSFRGVRS